MDYELELNKFNRLMLAKAFLKNKRVDYVIDCVLEGQMGKAFVDDLACPKAYRITTGPFWYFAGIARSPGGYRMIEDFPAYQLLMPSPAEWLEIAWEVHPQLQSFPRYSFSTERLSKDHLESIMWKSKYKDQVVPLDVELVTKLTERPESYLEIADYKGVEDFITRGMGFAVMDGDEILGAAYSSLVCSKGIEVSIYVEEKYRRQGVARALGSRLLLECLRRNLRPNWDAANPESCRLALKLGYVFTEFYEAYFYTT